MADFMRNRVLGAEEEYLLLHKDLMADPEHMRELGERIVRSAWFHKNSTNANKVAFALGTDGDCEYHSRLDGYVTSLVVHMGRHNRNKLTVIHAIAHYCVDRNSPTGLDLDKRHKAEFIKFYLMAIERWLGKEHKQGFKKMLVKHRVKTKAVSAETREKMRDNWVERSVPKAKEGLADIVKHLEQM